jgi:hypothetical protein
MKVVDNKYPRHHNSFLQGLQESSPHAAVFAIPESVQVIPAIYPVNFL